MERVEVLDLVLPGKGLFDSMFWNGAVVDRNKGTSNVFDCRDVTVVADETGRIVRLAK